MELLYRVSQTAMEAPERPAFENSEGETLTYGELERRSDCLAQWIAQRLPERGKPVAVLTSKQPAALCCFLDAMKAGHPYLPLDAGHPAARLSELIRDAKAGLLLCCENSSKPMERLDNELSRAGFPGVEVIRKAQLEDWLAHAPRQNELEQDGFRQTPRQNRRFSPSHPQKSLPPETRPISGEELAYLIYTSGSSGKPKGVQVPCRAVDCFCRWADSLSGFLTDRVYFNQASYSFDLSIMDTFTALYSGSQVFSLSPECTRNFSKLFFALERSRVSVWVSTPSFARFCLSDRGFCQTLLPNLRQFLFCGEPLDKGLAGKCMDRFPKALVFNTYGPTETTVAVTAVEVDREMTGTAPPGPACLPREQVPAGKAAPHCRIWIAGPDGAPLPDGQWGETVIEGDCVARGYTDPAETAKRFRPVEGRPAFWTGDRGILKNGLLYLSGRLDQQVKLHGYRVEPEETAAALRSLTGVEAAAVVPVFRRGAAAWLCGFVQLAPGVPLDAGTIRSELEQKLPHYLIPKEIRFLDALPLNRNEKIDLRLLTELAAETPKQGRQ